MRSHVNRRGLFSEVNWPTLRVNAKTYEASLIVFLVIILISCERVDYVKPTRQSITESVYASGVVKSRNQYNAFSKVAGVVDEILVQEGDRVRKRQVLLRISNDVSRLNVENSRLAANYTDFVANTGKLKEAQAAVELAKVRKENDSLLLFRQRNLWARGIGTKVALEQSEMVFKSSSTAYRQAIVERSDLERTLHFNASQSQTSVRINDALAKDYIVESMMEGKVYKLFPEVGEFVNTVKPVAIIGNADDFYLELKVDEYDIARVREGQRIMVTMDSHKRQVFEARVESIVPLMDEASRSFLVRAVFITKPSLLYPNLTLQGNIIIRTEKDCLTIPRNFLIGDSLVLLRGGVSKKVIVGAKDFQRAEIIDGLGPEDSIEQPRE